MKKNTTAKPVPALKQNFVHLRHCCKIVVNWKKQNNFVLGLKQVGEFLEDDDDGDDKVRKWR
jgi:hypothetical protein